MPAGASETVPPVTTTTTYIGGAGVPGIPKLKGTENYDDWSFSMKMALIDFGLWGCISGTDDNPDRKLRALAKSCMAVKTQCRVHLKQSEDPKAGWDQLKGAYQSKGLARKMNLKRKLYRMQREDFNSMSSYVSEMLNVAQQLAELDVPINEEELGTLLLCGLPDSDEHIVNGYCATNKEIKKSEVVTMLLDIESRQTLRSEGSGTALVTYGSKPKNSNFKVVCHECNEEGHIRPKCPKLKADKKKKNRNAKATAMISSESSNKSNLLFTPSVFAVCHLGSNEFYMDSCASSNVSCRKDWLNNFNPNASVKFSTADGGVLTAEGCGDIPVKLINSHDGKVCDGTVSKAMYAPEAAANLLSVSSVAKQGHILVFNAEGFEVYKSNAVNISGDVLFTGSQVGGIYKLDNAKSCVNDLVADKVDQVANNTVLSSVSRLSKERWHKRLGHPSYKKVDVLINKRENGLFINPSTGQPIPCISCIEGKQTRNGFPKGPVKGSKQLLELIHTDLCGPMSIKSWNGASYVLLFTDDFSHRSFVYFLASKSNFVTCFSEFKAMVETQTGLRIKRVRSDNGRAICNSKFHAICAESGIVHEKTVDYTPEQNGVSERLNRTIIEKARSMLVDSGLPRIFWAEAVNTAVYLKNRLPTTVLSNALPEEIWSGHKVDLSNLRIFGCLAYAHIPKQLRTKLDSKSHPLIMIGYEDHTKGYRLADIQNPGKVKAYRDVVFVEDVMPAKIPKVCDKDDESIFNGEYITQVSIETAINDLYQLHDDPMLDVTDSSQNETASVSMSDVSVSDESVSADDPENASDSSFHPELVDISDGSNSNVSSGDEQENVMLEGRPVRDRKPPAYLDDFEVTMLTHVDNNGCEPVNYSEAVSGPNCKFWKAAIDSEIESLVENNTWNVVTLPKGKKPISCKWVFKCKTGVDGLPKYKARLVARGFSQIQGIDYWETYSPVVRRADLRLLIALAAELCLEIYHYDVCTAFLNGDLSDEIYMLPPQGLITSNDCGDQVLRLNKAIYGLKQASRVWNIKVCEVTKLMGFTQSQNDPCIFYKLTDSVIVYIAIYVDDFLVVTNSVSERDSIKSNLGIQFKLKDLGPVKEILGMRVRKVDGKIFLDQATYIDNLVSRFGQTGCKTASTPMEAGLQLNRGDCNTCDQPYQNLVGALMYLAVTTRPDIMFACSYLSQFNKYADNEHYKYAIRVLRYLMCTKDLCLVYSKSGKYIEGFCDADFGNCIADSRKSFSGYNFHLGNCVFSWCSKKQNIIATSSTEAEFVSLFEAGREALYLKRLMFELTRIKQTLVINTDNQSAINLAKNPNEFHERTKHIGIKFYWCIEKKEGQLIQLKYLQSSMMTADIFTKALGKSKHLQFVSQLGMSNFMIDN